MQQGPKAPRSVVAVLAAAGAFGAVLWAVPLLLAAPATTVHWAAVLLPSLLASVALGFACGFWLGPQRQVARVGAALAAAGDRLGGVQAQLRLATDRAAADERRVQWLLQPMAPGAALLDPVRRLVAWNSGFAALCGVREADLRPGMPLADIAGLQPLGERQRLPLRSIEASGTGAVRRERADGSVVELRWREEPGGDLLLTLARVVEAASPPAQSTAELASLCREEVRLRLPRLQAAIVAGDVGMVRTEAHAIRGMAAGFGLSALAEALAVLEMAARDGDTRALCAAGPALPDLAEEALRQLAHPAI